MTVCPPRPPKASAGEGAMHVRSPAPSGNPPQTPVDVTDPRGGGRARSLYATPPSPPPPPPPGF